MPSIEAAVTEAEGLLEKRANPMAFKAARVALAIFSNSFQRASIPSDFFGGAPTSDASGYVIEAGVPVISWIGCPYYLLDSHDTLDKIDRDALRRLHSVGRGDSIPRS